MARVGEQSDLLDSFRELCETTLEHPGLARPLAFGAEGNIAYLVYSDLAGPAMDAMMREDGVRPIAEVLRRAGQLAEAIDFAASAGVHHGMMAPCDVILEGERTGVTGIGLAQALIKAGIPAEAVSPYRLPATARGRAANACRRYLFACRHHTRAPHRNAQGSRPGHESCTPRGAGSS